MKITINNALLARIKPAQKDFDIWDTKLTGFILRVYPSGKMVYRCEYARGKRITIGNASVLTPAEARDKVKAILGDSAKGIDPKSTRLKLKITTLQSFIENEYKPWVQTHRKRGNETVSRIKAHFFSEFGKKSFHEISSLDVERWRSARLMLGIKPLTINRDVAALRSVLSKAAEWEMIDENPLSKLKPLKAETSKKVRYLSKEEELKLRNTLNRREEKIKAGRDSANAWRRERGHEEMPSLIHSPFADYLKPMILISLNTGLRKGELLSLKWENVNFTLSTLTIEGESAKSGKTRHIPLNKEALHTLKSWHQQCNTNSGLVFSHKSGKPLTDIKKSWMGILKNAEIENFRWHDMRHHFASRLVMVGVDLNTVRELLGHSDIKMTLRYAHLAPEHKAQAVARLDIT